VGDDQSLTRHGITFSSRTCLGSLVAPPENVVPPVCFWVCSVAPPWCKWIRKEWFEFETDS
jgi:hypothetical protein